MSDTDTATQCAFCGDPIDAINDAYESEDGELLCADCYEDEIYMCARCRESAWMRVREKIGAILVVFDDDLEVPPGLYRIHRHPYYRNPMIGRCELLEDCLTRVADVPADMKRDWYPCGHLCEQCAKPYAAKAAKEKT